MCSLACAATRPCGDGDRVGCASHRGTTSLVMQPQASTSPACFQGARSCAHARPGLVHTWRCPECRWDVRQTAATLSRATAGRWPLTARAGGLPAARRAPGAQTSDLPPPLHIHTNIQTGGADTYATASRHSAACTSHRLTSGGVLCPSHRLLKRCTQAAWGLIRTYEQRRDHDTGDHARAKRERHEEPAHRELRNERGDVEEVLLA